MDGRGAHDESSGIGKLDRNEGDDDDGLELSLGLSLGGSRSKLNGMHPGKRLECSFRNVQNGRLSTFVSMGFREGEDPPQVSSPKEYPSNPQVEVCHDSGFHVRKQEGPDSTRLTAAQIWHAIQRSDATPATVMSSTYGNGLQGLQGTIEKPLIHGPSSVPSVEVPLNRNSTASKCLVRSSSASARAMSQKLVDLHPAPLVRQVSNNESFHDTSLDDSSKLGYIPQHQLRETFELQRKKELEAQIRMAARKRRKSLIEEKQLKRVKREEDKFAVRTKSSPISSVLNNCSATVSMPPSNSRNVDWEGLQRTGSNRWVQGWKTSVTVRLADDDNDSAKAGTVNGEQMQRLGISTGYTLDGDKISNLKGILGKKCTRQGVQIMEGDTLDGSDGQVETNGAPSELDVRVQPEYGLQSRKALANHQDDFRFVAITPRQSTSQSVKPKVEATANGSCLVTEDEKRKDEPVNDASFGDGPNRKICEGGSSRSESRNKIVEHNIMEMVSGDLDATSRKSASVTLGAATLQPALAVACNTLSYAPSSFPSFPYPSVPPPGFPLKMGFPFPYCMQFLTPLSSTSGDEQYPTFSQMPSPFQFPISSGFGSYLFPVPEQCIPNWYPVSHFPTWQTSVGSIPESSHASSSNGEMERDCVSSNEPESKDVESQTTSLSSVQGCSSLRGATKQVVSLTPQPRTSSPQSCDNTPLNLQAHLGHTHLLSDSNEKYFEREISRDNVFVSNAVACQRHQDLPASSQAPAQSNSFIAQSSCQEAAAGRTHAKGSQSACHQVRTAITAGCSGSGGNTASLSIKENFDKKPSELHTECFPDLPFVSTTGPAPDGKTVGGFMYVFDTAKVKIVCICHGEHLSPSEFVQHAGGTDLSNPERNILVNPFPYLGHMASATV